MLGNITLVVVLLIFNAFFAGSEMAFVSLNINRIKAKASVNDKKSQKIVQILSDSTNFLSSIQVGVTLSGFLASAFASEAFASVLVQFMLDIGLKFSPELIKPFAVIIITIILSYMTILFGELVPKKIAMAHPEKFSRAVVVPISFFSKMFTPLVKFLSFSTRLTLRLIGIDPDKLEDSATEEEIRLLASVSQESGNIDETEREMIENIFAFDDMTVEEIMTHRTEVLALSDQWSFEEIIDFVADERFTRYPIYKDSIDNIIGTIHLRDLLKYTHSDKSYVVNDILRKPYYIPTSKKTDDLFNEFKLSKTHIAIVVDEYGGTAGIVTMEDLIEEIMGDISDEYDVDESDGISKINEEMWIVEGDTELYDLQEALDIVFPIDKIDTVSGFIISELGRLPEFSDLNSIDSAVIYEGYRFIITKAEEKVVSKVKILKVIDEDEEDN
ncbi:MAG: HlyC/CorC family transporter [Erysipelothrix sp.]|nr:HlyC/CorC family transporter [Erysipelothrix sp.]